MMMDVRHLAEAHVGVPRRLPHPERRRNRPVLL